MSLQIGVCSMTLAATWQWDTDTSTHQPTTTEPTNTMRADEEDEDDEEDNTCSICRRVFDDTCSDCRFPGVACPPVKNQNCTHWFHLHCIAKWTSQQMAAGESPTCPYCRAPWID
ncbi:anaphase-promoting complex subunit 11 [Pelomyxa schiedti]|nr:anaphase-promoting complex subunit 11 [Pelomyxa schiedti]